MSRINIVVHAVIVVVIAVMVSAPTLAVAEQEELPDEYAAYLQGDSPDFDAPQPVPDTFGEITLINSPTVEQVPTGRLLWNIQHRMGPFEASAGNLLGLYSPANVRLGFYYGLHDRIQLGAGATQAAARYDLNTRVNIIHQESNGGWPVTVSYNGRMTMRGSDGAGFERFSHRIGYLHEFLVARKFSDDFSLQASVGVTHKNVVDSAGGYRNNDLVASVIGKYNVTPSWAVNVEAGQGQLLSMFNSDEASARSNPRFGLGLEYVSSAHAFQMFLASTNDILTSQSYVYNPHDIRDGNIFFGFNITRSWGLL